VEQVIGVARGESVGCHSVKIPGKRKSHIQSALPFALEDRITDNVEDLHFKLMRWQSGESVNAAVVSRDQISQWVEEFRSFGINLDAIVPDYMLLPLHPKSDITIARVSDHRICVRQGKFSGFSLDAEGFQFWWESMDKENTAFAVNDLEFARNLSRDLETGQKPESAAGPVTHWDIGEYFSEWLSSSMFSEDIEELNLLAGKFAPTHQRKSGNLLKGAAMVSVFAFAVYWGMLVYESRSLENRQAELETELRALFAEYFPGEPYLGRPRAQVESLIAQSRTNATTETDFQFYLNAISQVAPKFGAVVEEVNFRDNVVVVICTVKDLASLDTIQQAFNQIDSISAELVSSGDRDGKINGRFRLSTGVGA
jgi:general secretion pathway protein L